MNLLCRAALLVLASGAWADTLAGPECVVAFPPAARGKAERIVETFRWRRDHAAWWLGLESKGRADVHLVADHAAMKSLAPGAPSWAVAVTTGAVMVFRLDLVDRDPAGSLDLVLKHETVHFVLNRSGVRFPRWFEEGLAVHHAGLAYLEPDARIERVAAAGRLPPFAEADGLFEMGKGEAALGYALGQRAVREMVRRFGDGSVPRLVRSASGGAAFPDAFADATGETLGDFESRWRAEVTPKIPLWLFVIVENLDLALFFFGALLVAGAYARWRFRRERAMAALGGGGAAGSDAPPTPSDAP